LLTACSFRSTQWDLISSMWQDRQVESRDIQELTWTLTWLNQEFTLFPVVTPDLGLVDFMDQPGVITVSYRGQQITAARGLLPASQDVVIEKVEDSLVYSIAENVIAEHACSDYTPSLRDGQTVWQQACIAESGNYSNEIVINTAGRIAYMRFLIHPGYPQIELRSNLDATEF